MNSPHRSIVFETVFHWVRNSHAELCDSLMSNCTGICNVNFKNYSYCDELVMFCEGLYLSMVSWWRHQMETFYALPAHCAGIHRLPVNPREKGQWRRALMVHLICAQTNTWKNNGEAGDLRRHRGHYDDTIMYFAGTETVERLHQCQPIWVIKPYECTKSLKKLKQRNLSSIFIPG